MTNKTGRARCGMCDRIVYDPSRGRRKPTPPEKRELERTSDGATYFKYHFRNNPSEANVLREAAHYHAPGGETPTASSTVNLRCPGRTCASRYVVPELDSRLREAAHRGEDFILGWQYRT